jgi:uncharacterized repeat protein (TIGR03803 family)
MSGTALARSIAAALLLVASSAGLGLASAAPAAGSSQEKVLYAFLGGNDGANPTGTLLRDVDGALFGTTANGGPANLGTVFELAPGSGGQYTETVNHSFQGPDGAHPSSGMIKIDARSGAGTTRDGGAYGLGTVFEMTHEPRGPTERVLYSFKGFGDGEGPYGPLLLGTSGALYGTTTNGGGSTACAAGCGTVYRLTPAGSGYSEQVLYGFRGGPDGSHPYSNLIADATGALYGTTYDGGAYRFGSVFKLTPSRTKYSESILYRFKGGSDGANPVSGLLGGKRGSLFGTTLAGGRPNEGTVFELSPSSNGTYREHIKYDFTRSDGQVPYGTLISTGAHSGAGTTYQGGTYGYGAIFSLTHTTQGPVEAVLHSFTGNPDGANPESGVIADSSGNLYGVTYGGGSAHVGIVYELAP